MTALVVNIIDDPRYGLAFSVPDDEWADRFDDFLTEVGEIDYQLAVTPDGARFYIGRERTMADADALRQRFIDLETGARAA